MRWKSSGTNALSTKGSNGIFAQRAEFVEYQWFLINLSKAVEAGDAARVKDLVDKRQETKAGQEADQREMALFASRPTVAALNRANTRAGSALKGSAPAKEAADAASRELDNAYFVLANDVRKHLGMELLTIEDLKAVTPDLRSAPQSE